MNRKLGVEIYMSLFLILETIIWFIMKVTNVMIVEWWYILYTNLFTFMIYCCIFYNSNKREKLIVPFFTIVISCVVLGVILIMIPYFKEIHFILKIWLLFLITLIISYAYIYIKQSIKNNLEIKEIEDNYKKNIYKYEYYREIINQFSPAILSLVYNRKIKYSDTLVATILDLKLKNYIDIEDTGIKILKNTQNITLPNQKLIYEELEKKKNKKNFIAFEDVGTIFSNDYFKKEWKNIIKMEAEEKNLCSSKLIVFDVMEKICMISFVSLMVISISIITGRISLNIYTDINIISYLIIVSIHVALIFISAYLRKFNERNLFIRTKEGVELQCKMSGLKNYIEGYSQLEEKPLKELILWEDYLIYVVIFDLKGNLDKEARKLYEKLINTR